MVERKMLLGHLQLGGKSNVGPLHRVGTGRYFGSFFPSRDEGKQVTLRAPGPIAINRIPPHVFLRGSIRQGSYIRTL